MDSNKVLYISQEIVPYIASTLNAEMGMKLPRGVQEEGYEVRTFMPKYGCINERRNQLHEVIRLSGINIPIDDNDHPLIIKVATLQSARMQVYFIDNDDYFQRHGISALETQLTPADNDERCIFYVRGVMETVKKLRWIPAIIHCSGWISALAPLYLKKIYGDDPSYSSAKVVYSVQSDNLPELLDVRLADKLVADGVAPEHITDIAGKQADTATLHRIAIDYADAVVIAQEDVDPEIIKYAEASGKPLLKFPGYENMAHACAEFYKTL